MPNKPLQNPSTTPLKALKRCLINPTLTLSLAAALLTGCANRYSDHGNVTQVQLTHSEQQQVARNISQTLFSALGAKAVFDFPHDEHNAFASTLAIALRAQGLGVVEQGQQGYNTPLTYQLVALNPQQFYARVNAGTRQFTRIWSTQNNVLAPLQSQAQSGG